VPIDQQEIYKVNAGEDITMNLTTGDDGKNHYAVIAVSLVLNTNSDNYEKYGQDFLTSQDDSIKDNVIKVVSSYTYEQFTTDLDTIREELLEDMQDIFGSDYIVGVNFSKSTAE
jgi:flagellar FliL protein